MTTRSTLWVIAVACVGCGSAQTPCDPVAAASANGPAATPPAADAPTTDARTTDGQTSAIAAQVTPLTAVERRGAPNGQGEIAFLALGNNAFIGRLSLAPGGAVPEHQDPTEEYIHVLSGHGTMVIDGETHEISAGTTIFMPAGATVSYQNGAEELVAIQVFAGPGPSSKYDRWVVSESGHRQ